MKHRQIRLISKNELLDVFKQVLVFVLPPDNEDDYIIVVKQPNILNET